VLNAAEFRQFRSFIFRKVVQRHIWGLVGNVLSVLLQISWKIHQWKNF